MKERKLVDIRDNINISYNHLIADNIETMDSSS